MSRTDAYEANRLVMYNMRIYGLDIVIWWPR